MKKIKLGVVGVDSGQLLICDPCYIDSSWEKEEFTDIRRYRHTGTGDVFQYMKDFQRFDEPVSKMYPFSMNEMIENGTVYELPKVPAQKPFSYNACCKKTLADDLVDGQLNFPAGHPGVGVAFSSGYGDGLYDVFGHINKDGRIVKVEIIMK